MDRSFSVEPPHQPMSFDEWAALDEDEPGELVDGELVEEEVPDCTHELVVAWLIGELRAWIKVRGSGFVVGSEAKFKVNRRRGCKPDLSVYLPGGRLPPARGIIRRPSDILIEVISPTPRDGRRDRVEKMTEYAAFGARYYWLVDPQLRSLEIFSLSEGGHYLHALGVTDGVVEMVPGCEGLRLDLGALWAEVDRLGPAEPDEDL